MREDLRRRLNDTWANPPGIIGWLGAVNHKQVGLRYIVTALAFFILAGIDVTVLRAQLATPGADLVSPDIFNQLFTTHGSAMMFLFAVPMVEGIAIYVLPLMLGTREMAFPRLNAFGYWVYLFGGLLLYSSTLPDIVNFLWPGDQLLPDVVPDAGWFAYPPLSGPNYSPGLGLDFWLMGVTLAEISAIVAAVELVATILKTRAPGMTPMRLPLFAWSVLVMAFAIIFAFPAVVLASLFLELERAFGMPFYDPTVGGDPVLWQHLFWIFGHPEVYIQFIPATGIVSMVVPAFTGRPLIGYGLVVAAIIATGVLSFGLWVHHMFATGLPWLGLAYFSAASMLITIPSGIQVFAWLATMVRAPRITLATPMLFVIGFLVTFVLGGVTGVMVASVPFDLQSHDTYFVVAHFHYVLVGGVVFPIFAGLWYWFPKATGRMLSERLGKWFFWLFFIGFNVTFLPQHQVGLLGMRRRVYTYESEFWMDLFNLVSSVGQAIMIAGVAVLALAILLAFRRRTDAPNDPWQGRTLEWAVPSPPPQHNFTTLPEVASREPLADDPDLPLRIETLPPRMRDGEEPPELPRETTVVHALDALPQLNAIMPRNTLVPLYAAVAVAAIFVAFLFRLYPLAIAGALAAAALFGLWGWPGTSESQHPAAGVTSDRDLPTTAATGHTHVAWGGFLTIAVVGTFFLDAVFAHLYLAYKAESWPPPGSQLPEPVPGAIGTALVVAGAVLAVLAWRNAGRRLGRLPVLGAGAAVAALASAVGWTWSMASAPPPDASGFAAGLWGLVGLSLALTLLAVAFGAITAMRAWRSHFSTERHAFVQFTALWFGLAAVAAVLTYAVVQGAPAVLA